MRRGAHGTIVGLVAVAVLFCSALYVWSINQGESALGLQAQAAPLPTESAVAESASETLATGAQTLTASEVASLWYTVDTAASEGGWTSWGVVVDAETGQVLLEQDAQAAHTPASIMKILTAFTAMTWLDLQDTLQTGTSLEGSTLYLWGEGDLLLASGEGDETAVNGHAGLGDLAAQTASALAAQGISEVTLVYQRQLFSGDTKHSDWSAQDVDDYAGEVGPYAVNTGLSSSTGTYVSSSASHVVAIFRSALEANGITVASTRSGTAPETAVQLATVSSASIADQIQLMLENSDNTLAEQYCHLAAQSAGVETTFAGVATNVVDTLTAAGVSTQGIDLRDCSGLSSNNQIAAQTFIDIFEFAAGVGVGDGEADGSGDADSGNAAGSADAVDESTRVVAASTVKTMMRMLPLGGVTGTLANRFTEGAGLANVEAKTGSLGVASTLAGTVTTVSGQVLLFAIGNDDVADNGAYYTRDYLDQFVTALAGS